MCRGNSTDGARIEEIKQLLARTPIIRSACELDLLVFFRRHPRVLLTSEQVAVFLGYDMKKIAKAIEAFVEEGLLERVQAPRKANRDRAAPSTRIPGFLREFPVSMNC